MSSATGPRLSSCPDSPLRGPGGPRLDPPFPSAMAAVHRRFGRLTNWRGSISSLSAATAALLHPQQREGEAFLSADAPESFMPPLTVLARPVVPRDFLSNE